MSFPLNPAQREAVRYLDGPLLVLAGAGSGKTRVITAKIAHLSSSGFDPQRDRRDHVHQQGRARDARARRRRCCAAAAGKPTGAPKLTISTFHALGLRILRGDAAALGLKPGFSILDPDDIEPIVAELVPDDRPRARPRGAVEDQRVEERAGHARRGAARPRADDDERGRGARLPALRRHAARLPGGRFRRPDRAAGRAARDGRGGGGAMARALRASARRRIPGHQPGAVPAVAGCWWAIARRSPRSATTTRRSTAGAAPRSTTSRSCRADFPALKVVKLEQNYRSTVRILRSRQRADRQQPEALRQEALERARPRRPDPRDAGGRRRSRGRGRRPPPARAPLRAPRPLRRLRDPLSRQPPGKARSSSSCARRTCPYEISGGQSYFERTEIKDIVAYLRLIANDDDDPAFIRAVTTPKRGIGATTLEKLGAIGGARHESLFAAVFADETRAAIPARQREILDAFCALINGLRYRAEREPAARLLDELVAAIGYEEFLVASCDRKQAEARWKSVRDFVGWLSTKGEADGRNLLELTQTIALITMLEGQEDATPTRCACPRCTPRRGSSSRTCSWSGWRRAPAAPRGGRERQRRRGAPADVRRRHRARSAACTCPSAAGASAPARRPNASRRASSRSSRRRTCAGRARRFRRRGRRRRRRPAASA